ncbi:hypothetical protein ABZ297_13190 [Nonomuraea sp. NPDC005983]|uniref:hypothetical protein n=1 Tax=Nonomuraea sp. NPDC005983 TaxID=3155595 RepID=UPI0033A19F72
MRRWCVALPVLALAAAGCTQTPRSSPIPAAAPSQEVTYGTQVPLPEMARTATLGPVAASPRECVPPSLKVDQMRPVRGSGWTTLSTDPASKRFEHPSVAPDGAVWVQSWRRLDGLSEVRRWDGRAWRGFPRQPIGPGSFDGVYALVADSAGRAWAAGVTAPSAEETGTGIQRAFLGTFEDGRWRDVVFTSPEARGLSWSDVITGGPGTVAIGQVLLLQEGGVWHSHRMPEGTAITAVDGAGENVWVLLRGEGRDAVLRREGRDWRRLDLPKPGGRALGSSPDFVLTDVAVAGRDDAWVVGYAGWDMDNEDYEDQPRRSRPVLLHWNGSSWRCSWGPMHRTFEQAELDGRGGLWVLSDEEYKADELWHLSGERWTRERLPAAKGRHAYSIQLVRRPGSDEVYAIGFLSKELDMDGTDDPNGIAALWRTKS